MNNSKPLSGKSNLSCLKWLAVIVIIAAFIAALWINFGVRLPVEAADTTVGIFVDYDEVMRIANGNPGIEFRDMVREISLAGATGMVVRERLLAEWEISGDVMTFFGSDLWFRIQPQLAELSEAERESIREMLIPYYTFILIDDQLIFEQIFSLLDAKRRYPEKITLLDMTVIKVHLHSSERATLGFGFPIAELEQAAAAGLAILPRLRNWEPVTPENLTEVMRWVSMIPNMAAIGFNEPALPDDYTDDYIIEAIAEAIAPLELPLVSFEFYDQRGLVSLAAELDNYLLRVHAIGDAELRRYTEIQDMLNRYTLAATERNMRIIYVRFHNLINPVAAIEPAIELVEYVHEAITESGLYVGNPTPLTPYSIPLLPLILLGAGAIAGGGWLATFALGRFFQSKKWLIAFLTLLLFGFLVWIAALFFLPIFARKLFALASAIIFPSLGILLVLNYKLPEWTGVKRMIGAIAQLGVMSVFTFMGAMIMSSLLSEPVFFIKLDRFVGVTASYLAPLIVVLVILWLREQDWYGLVYGTAKSSVRFWQLGLCIIMFGALSLYVMRTGNDNPGAVSDLELVIRQLFRDILGVRPRTTEFLIGHPVMLVLLYYGYKISMFPVLLIGIMGQVSLMNTYAHIHTPIMVSLYRSVHGLWIGVLIGIILIIVLEFVFRKFKAIDAKYGSAGNA